MEGIGIDPGQLLVYQVEGGQVLEYLGILQQTIYRMYSTAIRYLMGVSMILTLAFFHLGCSTSKKTVSSPPPAPTGAGNTNMNAWQVLTSKNWGAATLMGQELDVENPNLESPTIRFAPDGRLMGSTGCNSFIGTFTLQGEGVKLDPGAMTKKACAGDQEIKFLEALRSTTNLIVSGQSISLVDDKQTVLMRLKPKL